MKKLFRGDYFYFSKSDRIATFVLLLIIIAVNIARVKLDRPIPPELTAGADSIFFTADTVTKRRTYSQQSAPAAYKQQKYSPEKKQKQFYSDTVNRKRVHDSNIDTIKTRYPEYTVKSAPQQAVDINSADSLLLTTLPGIGPFYARKIVEYRELLGGYVDVQQLKDIDGLQDSILRWFVVTDTVPVRKVNINRLSVSKLSNHPYISFYQARAISEYRRSEGDIKNPAPLSLMEEFTEQDIIRLEPYLSFE